MTTYWITFRILKDQTYEKRRDAFLEAIHDTSETFWEDTTSFIVFSSSQSIEEIAESCERAISPKHDLFLIRQIDKKSAYICGKNEDLDIFKLMPYLKNF